MFCEFNSRTRRERRQLIGSLRCTVHCGYFIVDWILAIVHVVVVLIWTAHQSSGEYVEVWIRTVECVPVTCGRRVGARNQTYLSHETMPWLRDCRSFWMRSSLHFLSLLTTLFDAGDFLCGMNINYGVLFIAIGKKLKVCSIPWHKSCIGCGRRCRQRGYGHQMLTLDGDWWQATWSYVQANTVTTILRLLYNKLSRGGPGKT